MSANRDSLKSALWPAAFVIALCYVSIGFYPISPVEGDGNGIANGAAFMALRGIGDNEFSYRYAVQTGTYALVAFLHKKTGLSTLSAFSLLGAISATIFIALSAVFIGKIANVSWAICGMVLLLFQEAYTVGYYPNSTAIAAAFLAAAFCLAVSGQGAISLAAIGVLAGLSIWMRFDTVLLLPVLLMALYRTVWRQVIRQSIAVVSIATLVSGLAIHFSGGSVLQIVQSTGEHVRQTYEGMSDVGIPLVGNVDFLSHVGTISVLSVFLIILGLRRLFVNHRWHVLGLTLSAVVPFYLVLTGKVTSPKYLCYLLPFFALMSVYGLMEIAAAPHRISGFCSTIVVFLFMAQYVLGVQVDLASKPYMEKPFPTVTRLLAAHTPLKAIRALSLTVGAGSYISTADGNRLSSGILFAPIAWSYMKRELNSDIGVLVAYLEGADSAVREIVVDEYEPRQLLLSVLISRGYSCSVQGRAGGVGRKEFHCTQRGRVVNICEMQPNDNRQLGVLEENLSALGASRVLFVATYPWERHLVEQYLLTDRSWRWRKVNSFAYELSR